eukprot:Awhi_evm1s7737
MIFKLLYNLFNEPLSGSICAPTAISGYRLGADIEQLNQNFYETHVNAYTCLASKCAPTAISGYRLGADIEQLNQGFFETHENAYTCLGDLAIIKNA